MNDLSYWLDLYGTLRESGKFRKADELREMLRRMGFVLRTDKDKITTAYPYIDSYGELQK